MGTGVAARRVACVGVIVMCTESTLLNLNDNSCGLCILNHFEKMHFSCSCLMHT